MCYQSKGSSYMDLEDGTLFSKNNQDKLEQFAAQLKSVHIELN